MNAFEKISNEEMMCIDGGFNPGVILPGVAAVWVCYEIGYAVGKAFVHHQQQAKQHHRQHLKVLLHP